MSTARYGNPEESGMPKPFSPESEDDRRETVERWEESPSNPVAFRALDRATATEVFLKLSSPEQYRLLEDMPPGEQRLWMRVLAPDDAADVIQWADDDLRATLIGHLDAATQREVRALAAYAEDAAGGLMSPRFAALRAEMTVDEAIHYLRRKARDGVETIYTAYVLDHDQRLVGVVSFRELFSAQASAPVRDVMRPALTVTEDLDQEHVARIIAEHNLLAIPVVDQDGRMKGIITVDDVVDVVQEEATEDIQKLGGMEALDDSYMDTPFFSLLSKRAGWLAVLFVGETLTASAMGVYEEEITKAAVLVLFIPLIISSGGNSGSQASSLIMRSLALGEVTFADFWRVTRRELLSGLALGTILGVIGVIRIYIWQVLFDTYDHVGLIAITVALALIGVVTAGTLLGAVLPMLLKRAGLDPATASTPMVATLVDVAGLVIYFGVASVILRGTLL